VDDQIDVMGRAMLGLTVSCARCHDHKFDAIRTTDYYSWAGIFRSTEPFMDENRNATMWWEFSVPQGGGGGPLTVMAPRETAPRNLRVHLRGSHHTLGKTVPRRAALQVLAGEGENPIGAGHAKSGRLELAGWIASPDNPLTARVMVNRIWQHHFGRGLVATSDNFGTRGGLPSHPQLLDWLAARFVESGWSVKAMHRLILNSSAYQQGVGREDSAPAEGRCSPFSRRRLSAEELRDAMLAVSGNLDRTPGTSESGEFLWSRAEDIGAKIRPNRVAVDDPYYSEFRKRTIYLPVVRNMLPDVLALFDAADPNGVTARRNETTVASQALFLLNSPFVREQARAFAHRLLKVTDRDDDSRLAEAHRLAFGRFPSDEERKRAHAFLAAYSATAAAPSKSDQEVRLAAWQSYCQTLLCANEFMYLE
ncbi:MAG: DUF1553 domain-containing protein, partial [Akkermansiaceae bacterium]|nr:DUF1553 domain-containing protein [Akkermansiaceae bacterium]